MKCIFRIDDKCTNQQVLDDSKKELGHVSDECLLDDDMQDSLESIKEDCYGFEPKIE
jgi:hypothetical protein